MIGLIILHILKEFNLDSEKKQEKKVKQTNCFILLLRNNNPGQNRGINFTQTRLQKMQNSTQKQQFSKKVSAQFALFSSRPTHN